MRIETKKQMKQIKQTKEQKVREQLKASLKSVEGADCWLPPPCGCGCACHVCGGVSCTAAHP